MPQLIIKPCEAIYEVMEKDYLKVTLLLFSYNTNYKYTSININYLFFQKIAKFINKPNNF